MYSLYDISEIELWKGLPFMMSAYGRRLEDGEEAKRSGMWIHVT